MTARVTVPDDERETFGDIYIPRDCCSCIQTADRRTLWSGLAVSKDLSVTVSHSPEASIITPSQTKSMDATWRRTYRDRPRVVAD